MTNFVREDGMSLFKQILHCLDCLHSELPPIDEGISYTIIKTYMS